MLYKMNWNKNTQLIQQWNTAASRMGSSKCWSGQEEQTSEDNRDGETVNAVCGNICFHSTEVRVTQVQH